MVGFIHWHMKTSEYRFLGEGGCHAVYDMGDGNVVKRPKRIWQILCQYETAAEDARLASRYFKEFLWPSAVLRNEKNPREYSIVQPLLPEYRALTSGMLEDPEIREQFDEFLRRNESLYADTRHAFDFFGLEGMVAALVAEESPKGGAGMAQAIRKAFGQLVMKAFLGRDEVEADVPASNVLVLRLGGKSVLRVADPTLTNEGSGRMEDLAFAYCCNLLNKRYLKKRFGKDILTGWPKKE